MKNSKNKKTKIVRTFSPIKKTKTKDQASTNHSANLSNKSVKSASINNATISNNLTTSASASTTTNKETQKSVTNTTSNANKTSNLISPYAYVRFSNEQITLKACLNSIKGFFSRGILCYHPPLPGIDEDNSLAIAEEFVAKNPGFRLVKYPFPVIYHNNDIYFERSEELQRNWLLDSYSTFALLHLKQLIADYGDTEEDAFIFKVDADHVYSEKALKDLYKYAIEHPEYDLFCSYQYNVVRNLNDPNQTPWFISLENTWDHFFVRANKIKSFTFVIVQDPNYTAGSDLPHGGFERAMYADDIKICFERYFINSIHFNREKFLAYNDPTQQEIAKIYETGFSYEQLNFADLYKQASDVNCDHEFFSPNFVYSLLLSFDYSAVKEGARLGRKFGNVDELINNPIYRIETFVEKFNIDNGLIDQGKIKLDQYDLYIRILSGRIISQMFGPNSILEPVIRQPDFGSVEDEIKAVLEQRDQDKA